MYEGTLQYITIDNKGNDKVVKEKFILDNTNTFGQAEEMLYKEGDGQTDLDVIAIKRSKIREIVNKRNDDEDKVFVAEIADIRINDDGEETMIVYKVALFAKNYEAANKTLKDYLAQGFDMEIISIKRTNFIDVL